MDFKQWQQEGRELGRIVEKADSILIAIAWNWLTHDGLVRDEFRCSKKYREAKSNFDKAFEALRQFNKDSPKKYIKEETRLRRANRKVV